VKKRVWLVGGLSSLGLLNSVSPGWATPIQQEPSVNVSETPVVSKTPVVSEAPAALETPATVPLDDRPLSRCAALPQQVQPDILESGCEWSADDSMAQMRSVNELSDVRPTDWAYQTLQSLSERYGVAIGYPDGTYRGNQALTRNEFAATLAKVLDVISQQYVLGQGNIAQLQEDFATLQRLQVSYGTIATDLRGRADKLEQEITTLERQRFSTTTKLSGQTVIGLTNGSNARSTVLFRTRLDLLTSFAPNTLLRTQLEVGNNANDAIGRAHNRGQNLLGTLGLLADGGGLDYVGVDSAVRLSKLYYTFQPADGFELTVGARISPRDFIDYNRFANDSTKNFSSSFFTNNPLIVQNQIDRPGGAGAVLAWKALCGSRRRSS
jgi:hypothetical protein